MKKILFALCVAFAGAAFITSCSNDDDDTDYTAWSKTNEEYLQQQANLKNPDGTPIFTRYTPMYDGNAYILYRFIGDPAENAGNLQPLYTSTVTVNYQVHLCDGTKIDSAANYTNTLSDQGFIAGWPMAICRMHVGDSIEALLPYQQAYGASGYSNVPPFSTLRFNLRLVDIPAYEIRN